MEFEALMRNLDNAVRYIEVFDSKIFAHMSRIVIF